MSEMGKMFNALKAALEASLESRGYDSDLGGAGEYSKLLDAFAEVVNPLLERLEQAEKDARRLDSGCIMTHERDEFGDEYQCERRGLDLRKAIDAAIASQEGKSQL